MATPKITEFSEIFVNFWVWEEKQWPPFPQIFAIIHNAGGNKFSVTIKLK